jgi:hypothetical protein
LPQETILFDGAKLSRTLSINLAEDAGLLAVEALVLGRRAFGERVRSGSLHDHWRVRRAGRRRCRSTTCAPCCRPARDWWRRLPRCDAAEAWEAFQELGDGTDFANWCAARGGPAMMLR